MGHPTSQGLAQEEGALILLANAHQPDLEKRGVTSDFLAKYETLTNSMVTTVAASTGKTSDKKQLTASELATKDELLADIRRIQHGAKRAFPKGSPQLKEFFVGEYFNHSTAVMNKWAAGIATAWPKYKLILIAKGNLIQPDEDSLEANSARLKSVDSSQETAKHTDAPEATDAARKAMAEVEAAADFIYGAAEAEYAKNPQTLGEFESLRPLRYAIQRNPKNQPASPAAAPPAATFK